MGKSKKRKREREEAEEDRKHLWKRLGNIESILSKLAGTEIIPPCEQREDAEFAAATAASSVINEENQTSLKNRKFSSVFSIGDELIRVMRHVVHKPRKVSTYTSGKA